MIGNQVACRKRRHIRRVALALANEAARAPKSEPEDTGVGDERCDPHRC